MTGRCVGTPGGVNNFLCYRTAITRGAPPFVPVAVVPVTVWFAPSVAITRSAGHPGSGALFSTQVKCAVTGVLFHAFPLGAGLSDTVIVGVPPS